MIENPEQLRAALEVAEERIERQREALECLNGFARERANRRLRAQEQKLQRCWTMLEEIEESTFASSVLEDIASL